MDGCKKIKSTKALVGLLLAIALIGCRSQHIGVVNLFVDSNMLSEKDEKQSSYADSTFENYRNDLQDTLAVNDSASISEITFIDTTSMVGDSLLDKKEIQSSEFKDSLNLSASLTENELKTSIDSVALGDDNSIFKDSVFYRNKHNQIVQQQLLIDSLRSKMDELQTVRQNVRVADTIIKEIPVKIPVDTNTGQPALHQELYAKDDTLQQLRNQLKNQQTIVQKTDTVTIIKEVDVTNPTSDTDGKLFALQQELHAKDDTLQQLRNQLKNQQTIVQKTDTITIVKEVAVDSPTPDTRSELLILQQELQAKDDTLQQLRNQLKNQQTIVHKTDTIISIAYYNIGKIRPENETELFNQIKDIIQDNNIERVVLSGHTDITGNSEINKKLTSERLEYILSKIKIYFPIEFIFIQNFADTFASDTIVPEERRVEIVTAN